MEEIIDETTNKKLNKDMVIARINFGISDLVVQKKKWKGKWGVDIRYFIKDNPSEKTDKGGIWSKKGIRIPLNVWYQLWEELKKKEDLFLV